MAKAFVAFTLINNKKQYITSGTCRPDNLLVPSINSDITKAKEFETKTQAESFIKRIYNPFERKYNIETITVSAPKPAYNDDDFEAFTTFPG